MLVPEMVRTVVTPFWDYVELFITRLIFYDLFFSARCRRQSDSQRHNDKRRDPADAEMSPCAAGPKGVRLAVCEAIIYYATT
mgnify:CR=1 FL=1